ncbi:acyltransferase [Neolentinus lepideus HHB14362 ss-1]|uniref:Acyltransferase n=1 Tax=Neolentinus lepideus HHB14362 ss-1 TaxID=1314782 RepID=A0A165T0Q9_9AGAM|nr:acyltransferase [Neolentinus lepideus HHB14362 ss-1]
MELKLVYRILRKISDWSLSEFYSEVYVEGQDNVPQAGPLIIVASHHNEMIDIATLAATIPHRRPLCFWAKSTMFKNPISRAILTSSGSIPVYRNPNSSSALSIASSVPNSYTSKSLFTSTSEALAKGEVIGVFPEGTSYTEPRIAQVKEGAAWAAVEYVRWAEEHGGLRIVPVGIVYTDKSQFQSRVSEYGEPIQLSEYAERILSAQESEEGQRSVVKKLTIEIEERMVELTVNAPDWNTLYISRIIRDLLWPGARGVPLNDFVHVSQKIIMSLASSPDLHLNQTLLKYYSLLHYTGLSHPTLSSILPNDALPVRVTDERVSLLTNNAPSISSVSAWRALRIFATNFVVTLLHPRFVFFIPPLVVHTPAYIMGNLAARFLATKGEEEGIAQYKVIVGGVGRGLGLGAAGISVSRFLRQLMHCSRHTSVPLCLKGLEGVVRSLGQVAQCMFCGSGWTGKVKEVAGVVGTMYLVGWALVNWHNALVGGLWKRLRASYTLVAGFISSPLPAEAVTQYCTPPPPVVNPFIKRYEPVLKEERVNAKPVAARRLIRHLLVARVEAVEALKRWDELVVCGAA